MKVKNTKVFTINNESIFTYVSNKAKAFEAGSIFRDLKLVSAIFYQIFIFSPHDSPSKAMKSVFYLI